MGFFSKRKANTKIYSPVDGKLIPLKSIEDGVFSEGMLGNGFAVTPISGKVYAPMDGELITVFPTGHAYGIQANDGTNVLVHIGIDTVNLGGEGFTPKVKQNQKVKKGDLLAEVDLDLLKSKQVLTDVIVVITSDSSKQPIVESIKTSGDVTTNDVIIEEFA